MKKDDIEFPTLPGVFAWAMVDDELAESVQEYARAAIEADRQRRSEPVGYVHPANEHRLYSGETVAFRQRPYDGEKKIPVYLSPQPTEEVFCEECGDGLVVEDPDICGTCYQTKYVSPQNSEPVKVPSDEELGMLFSMWGWRTKDGRELRFSHFKEMVQILLARYGHNYQPRYKNSDDFHANASLPELDAWQRGWDDCNKGIEAEGWQLVPKELIEFIEDKEHHLPIEDRHALSNMIKAAPKFGEEE